MWNENSNDDRSDKIVKRKAKDSVFTKLFQDINNVYELYRELHPEDTSVTIDDIQIETLETVLVNEIYNDLGFIVRSGDKAKIIILVEAQSKWTENLTLRMLLYIVETYRRYLNDTKQSEHLEKKVHLPKPELYIVYTGNKDVPEEISFSETYFDGDSPIDLRLKLLKKPGNGTLHGQYIGFCKVYDEQRKIYSNKLECIRETIRICIEKGYLTNFLEKHKQEATTMMSELFDEEALRERYENALKEQYRNEGEAIGQAKGEAIGQAKGVLMTLSNLVKRGLLSITDASKEANMSVSEFEEITGLRKACE